MQYVLLKKTGVIAALMLLLTVALSMTGSVISERQNYRQDARNSIAQSWTGEQQVVGPVLVLPYQQRVEYEVWDAEHKEKSLKTGYRQQAVYVIPEALNISGEIRTELRYRGLYGIPVYSAQLQFDGSFDKAAVDRARSGSNNAAHWDAPYLALIVSDIRGIAASPKLAWRDGAVDFAAGSGINNAPQGMHAQLPMLPETLKADLHYAFELNLRGMENLGFAPAGNTTRVEMHSDWRHPSFNGSYLPERREIGAAGFSALWQVSSFSSDIGRQLQVCQSGECAALLNNRFGVALLQPVDVYSLSERAVKYGMLFISVVFIAFLVIEVTHKRPIHPIQYLLVGLALAVFYLLLVSLSEHIAFGYAYAAAASACTLLLGYYLSAVLGGAKPGVLSAALLAAIYSALYVIINSEDSALLMGSGLLFVMLAVLMATTRRLDWYALGARGETAPP